MATAENKVKLEVGMEAPDFTAKVQYLDKEETIKLSDLVTSGKKVLLVFYPKDMTSGCTKQLCGIRDVYESYQKKNVIVLGVNQGDGDSHLKFIQMHNYQFGIVVDADMSIREKYGAVGSYFGNKITKRGVFLIDENMQIIYRFWGQQDNQKIFDLLES